MKIFLKVLKVTGYLFLIVLVLAGSYFGFYYWKKNQKDNDLITIEVTYMQYACGDWNDDMKVEKVNNKKYSFLIGRDIDPYIHASEYDLKDYFYDNKTNKFYMILVVILV